MPTSETVDGVTVDHPPYPHWPGISVRQQARRMARASRDAVAAATAVGDWILDVHYLYPDGVAAAAIAEQLSLPYVLTARGTDIIILGEHHAAAPQIRRAVQRAQALVAVSDDLAKRMISLGELEPDRVHVLRNGVDLDRFCPGDRATARRALGLPETGPLILAVGLLIPRKAFHLAARALSHLPDAKLVLVGEGPQRRRIAAAAPGRCHFLGSLPPDEVALAYRACNVLVLPSTWEGWPNVVNEALASGLPVVASAVGSLPEILADPAVGAVVPQGELDPMVAALERFLHEPPEPGRVVAFGRRYSWDEPVAKLVELFRGLGLDSSRTA